MLATRPLQLTLLPEEDAAHQQHELWLGDAYARAGRYREAARQYRQLLDHAAEDEGHLPEPRVEVLARLADIQLKLDEAAAVEEVEARQQAATAAAAAGPDAAQRKPGSRPGSSPGSPAAAPRLPGRTVSNLQLEVLSAQALADDAAEGGGGEPGTAQTLLELCSSERAVWGAGAQEERACCTCCAPTSSPSPATTATCTHHPVCAVAPPAERFIKYHEEWLKRCLLRIFAAPPRSGARDASRALHWQSGSAAHGGAWE